MSNLRALHLALLAALLFAAACGGKSKTTPDGAMADDAGGDAQIEADAAETPNDAAQDATQDSATPQADHVLFAHINNTLVRVDPTDGALTDVGPTGQDVYFVMSWDSDDNVARVIVGPYSPTGGGAVLTPRLGTIDLCTGTVTEGPAITINGDQVRRAEGLVEDPATHTYWITVGTTGTGAPTQYLSESNGTVNTTTGAVTVVGNHQTYQDDGDWLTFIGSSLTLLDVASGSSQGAIYTINQSTGAATKRADTGPTVLRIAYDPTREVLFGTTGTGTEGSGVGRGVVTIDPDTGAFTSLGTTLGDGTYGGGHFTGLLPAPEPDCED